MIAPLYDAVLGNFEKKTLLPYRKRFVPMIHGKCLDLAAGTGPNIEWYNSAEPHVQHVTLVDKSAGMLEQARAKEQQTRVPLAFVQAPLEQLPFENTSFDCILSIDVLCSVQDQQKALLEVNRVLKAGGTAIFVEHFKTDSWTKNLGLYALTYGLLWWLLDISMVRETDKSIGNIREWQIVERGKLGHSFQYFVCNKK